MEKLAYSVSETAQILGVSRPKVYDLLHRSDFPSFRIGGRVLVSADGLRHWVAAQADCEGETDR